MTKQEFDSLYVGDPTRVHCSTKELNDEFIKLARSFGYTIKDNWDWYKNEVCYNVAWNFSSSITFYTQQDYDVVEFKSLKEESMKDLRDLLEVGRVVETRDGCIGFVSKDKIIYKSGWDDLKLFNTELKCETFKNSDIVRVYDSPIVNDLSWNFGSSGKDLLNLVWERKEFEVSEDEKTILKNVDKTYDYIARDADGELGVYKSKPNKSVKYGIWKTDSDGLYTPMIAYNHLFNFIKCEDEEPVLIADLLK